MQKYEGKTLDDALKAASEALHTSVENVISHVVEEKKGGLFGIGAKTIIEAYSLDSITEFITAYLTKYFEGIGLKTEVLVNRNEERFNVVLNAENNAILIGKAGQTLQAITSVVKAATNAEFKRRVNISVDVNGYKEERFEKLRDMCNRIAKTVVKTKVSARLGQLTGEERKIVHQYLSEYPGVRTESEGEGNDRRLKIIYDPNKK